MDVSTFLLSFHSRLFISGRPDYQIFLKGFNPQSELTHTRITLFQPMTC